MLSVDSALAREITGPIGDRLERMSVYQLNPHAEKLTTELLVFTLVDVTMYSVPAPTQVLELPVSMIRSSTIPISVSVMAEQDVVTYKW